ncbi:MAG: PCP reductase family protein [Acidobacteriota bacterium]
MKFLCMTCDEPMKIQHADPPDDGGSISAIFGCPTCSHRIAMLTNPYETQMVQSLGVKIGPGEEAPAEDSPAARAAAGGCPFSGMIGDMERAKDDEVLWTASALQRLENIPEFVRPMAKQGIEHYAKSIGHEVVDDELMEEARGRFGM